MCRCFCNCKILHARPLCVLFCCLTILIIVVAGAAIAYYWSDISGESGKKNWNCSYSSCKICKNLDDSPIHLHDTMCANITYFSEDEGFLYLVSVNQTTIANETRTDPNVPPVCFNAFYVDKNANTCIYLYDINVVSNSTLHVCAKIETTKKLHLLKKYELGCIDVHSITKNNKKTVPKIDPTDHTIVIT